MSEKQDQEWIFSDFSRFCFILLLFQLLVKHLPLIKTCHLKIATVKDLQASTKPFVSDRLDLADPIGNITVALSLTAMVQQNLHLKVNT